MFKNPSSVLVVIYTPEGQFLMLERAAHPGFWQSVTGSQEAGESLSETALREVREETGISVTQTLLLGDLPLNRPMPENTVVNHASTVVYPIFSEWQHRYPPGTTHNTEHLFSLCLSVGGPIQISAHEHRAWRWENARAAAKACFSPSNAAAIDALEIRRLLNTTKTIAVVGLSQDPAKASNRVARYLQSQGYRIIPVTPRPGDILGEPSYPDLAAIPYPVDMVNVFRPAQDCPEIAKAAVEIGAKTLWLQLDIHSEEAAETAVSGGLSIVMNRCLLIEHQSLQRT